MKSFKALTLFTLMALSYVGHSQSSTIFSWDTKRMREKQASLNQESKDIACKMGEYVFNKFKDIYSTGSKEVASYACDIYDGTKRYSVWVIDNVPIDDVPYGEFDCKTDGISIDVYKNEEYVGSFFDEKIADGDVLSGPDSSPIFWGTDDLMRLRRINRQYNKVVKYVYGHRTEGKIIKDEE
ncbi:MAG: hypothetical protein ACP5N3_01905 [Candidatus Nanoarchaeia archaeon]